MQRRQFMNIISFIIDLKSRSRVSRQFNQCSGLEHGGQCTAGRVPGSVANHFDFTVPQNRFSAEQQRSCGDVVIAGDNRDLPDLRIFFPKDIQLFGSA